MFLNDQTEYVFYSVLYNVLFSICKRDVCTGGAVTYSVRHWKIWSLHYPISVIKDLSKQKRTTKLYRIVHTIIRLPHSPPSRYTGYTHIVGTGIYLVFTRIGMRRVHADRKRRRDMKVMRRGPINNNHPLRPYAHTTSRFRRLLGIPRERCSHHTPRLYNVYCRAGPRFSSRLSVLAIIYRRGNTVHVYNIVQNNSNMLKMHETARERIHGIYCVCREQDLI